MFISGKGVSRTDVDNNLVTSNDVFGSISELAGISVNEIHDSKSFKSLLTQDGTTRNFQYAEKNSETDDSWAISDGSYKLIENASSDQEFYDLNSDPFERDNLFSGSLPANEVNAKLALEAELLNIRR